VNTLRKRLDIVEERILFQQHMDLARAFEGRSLEEQAFFCIHGYWPENVGDDLPHRIEFTVRGIRTIVTTEWEDENKKTNG